MAAHHGLGAIAHVGREPIRYWRTKHGAEVDFVLARRSKPPVAIECKWSADQFEPDGLKAFRARYPLGPSFVVTADTAPGQSYTKRFGNGLEVTFTSLEDLVSACT